MSPETLILIDRAKDVIKEAEGLIEQIGAIAERRRVLDARRYGLPNSHRLKPPGSAVDQPVAGDHRTGGSDPSTT
jgi:hypothetical protein